MRIMRITMRVVRGAPDRVPLFTSTLRQEHIVLRACVMELPMTTPDPPSSGADSPNPATTTPPSTPAPVPRGSASADDGRYDTAKGCLVLTILALAVIGLMIVLAVLFGDFK